ncbi:MAG: DUF6553 family protein [Eubacteriales bacterium]|jgi:hypothetical protein
MEKKPWVVQYMYELDRKKRKELLDRAIELEGETPENELRRKLYDARYDEIDGQNVDYFIRGWMGLFYLKGTTPNVFTKRKISKTRREIFSDWKMQLMEEYGDVGRDVMYEEFFNTTKLYIDLCKRDKGYNSVLLGLGKIKEDTLTGKIANDIFDIAWQVPRDTGMAEELEVFTRAATDAFCSEFDSDRDLLMNQVRKLEEDQTAQKK